MQHEKNTRSAATQTRAHEDNQLGNKPTGPRNRALTADERVAMIRENAYHRAAKRGFTGGDPLQDWFEAEREVDAFMRRGSLGTVTPAD